MNLPAAVKNKYRADATIGYILDKEHVFKIITDKKPFYFACDTKNELDEWFKQF